MAEYLSSMFHMMFQNKPIDISKQDQRNFLAEGTFVDFFVGGKEVCFHCMLCLLSGSK
jgi:hypothetical protein